MEDWDWDWDWWFFVLFFYLRRVAPAFIFPFQRFVSCFSLVPFGFADVVRSLVKNSLLVAAILFCYICLPVFVCLHTRTNDKNA